MQQPKLQESILSLSFYFFINTMSGNQKGSQLVALSPRAKAIAQTLASHASVTFVDLFNKQQLQESLAELRKNQLQGGKILRAIICGGDGTVSWVMNELVRNQVDLSLLAFGVLPIGTGNDFCRSLGWDTSEFEFTQANLIQAMRDWSEAAVKKYDIWQVQVETFSDGKIFDIKNKKEEQRDTNSFRKLFSNYVGMGLDARVVYTMEKHRTVHAAINKFLYGLIGCLNFFRPIKQLISKIAHFGVDNDFDFESTASQLQKEEVTQKKLDALTYNGPGLSIKKGFKGIVCLNCTSYMAGLRQVWNTKQVAVNQRQQLEFTSQKIDDGKVEFVAFKSQLNLALERVMRSGARVAQGDGPFQISMIRPKKQQVTHLQIDGESIKVYNLKRIRINRTTLAQNSQVNVLVRLQ